MSGFHAFVEELFAGFGPVRFRRMFGVVGLYAGDLMFGLIDDETIYLRTDEALRRAGGRGLGGLGLQPRTEPRAVSPYWRLPEAALDDPDEAAAWARKALAVARPRRLGNGRGVRASVYLFSLCSCLAAF